MKTIHFIILSIIVVSLLFIFRHKIIKTMSKLKQLITEAIQSLERVEEEAEKLEPVITEPTPEPELKETEEVNIKVYLSYESGKVHFKNEESIKALVFSVLDREELTHSKNGEFSFFNIINEFDENAYLRPTYKDGNTLYVFEFKISANETIDDVEDEVIPEPNPSTIKTVNINLEENDIDNTAHLRTEFKDSHAIYKLSKGKFWAEGKLDSDAAFQPWNVRNGEHGIIRIEDKTNIFIDGTECILFNKEPCVWDGDLDDDGLTDIMPETGEKYPTDFSTMSQRKFLNIRNSKYIHVDGLTGESFNNTSRFKAGRPEYDAHWEFEHLIDARNSQYIALTNLTGRFLGGDGIYINNSDDVFAKNNLIHWNGRQGEAMIAGNRGYFERQVITNSRRGGLDIEGNVLGDDTQDFVITFSYFDTHLIGLPMGGMGLVKNVLSINNRYLGSQPIFSKGNGVDRLRENAMFVGNRSGSLGYYSHTKNILIDGNEQDGWGNGDLKLGSFSNCKNITIRNNDMTSYGREGKAREPFYVVEAINTPIKEFKVYNNKQKIGIVNRDIVVRADEVEVGKYYFIKTAGDTNFEKLYPNMVQFSYLFKPNRKATVLDFNYNKEYNTMEKAVSDIPNNIDGSIYRVEDLVYRLKVSEYILMKVEELGTLYPIEIPEEYVPTEEEAKSIPFPTSEYIEFHWNRLYGKSWRPEEYVDDGWKPEWMNDIKK